MPPPVIGMHRGLVRVRIVDTGELAHLVIDIRCRQAIARYGSDVAHVVVRVGEVLPALGDVPASSSIKKRPYPE